MKIRCSSNSIPSRGSASGYQGTITIYPKAGCKGIPDNLMGYIHKIYNRDIDFNNLVGFVISDDDKLLAQIGVNSLTIEYSLGDSTHTSNSARAKKFADQRESLYNQFISELIRAGWDIEEEL